VFLHHHHRYATAGEQQTQDHAGGAAAGDHTRGGIGRRHRLILARGFLF
jgi:hypothetical protein